MKMFHALHNSLRKMYEYFCQLFFQYVKHLLRRRCDEIGKLQKRLEVLLNLFIVSIHGNYG